MELFNNHTLEQLQALRIQTIRSIGAKTTLLEMINEEVISRTPHDQEATVIEFRREE